jgi:hypothetical protein
VEVSAVGVPANPNALALALRSGAVQSGDLLRALEHLGVLRGAAPHSSRTRGQRLDDLLSRARELQQLLLSAVR